MLYNPTPSRPFFILALLLFTSQYFSCTQAVYPGKSDIKEFFTQFEHLTNRDSATYSFYNKKILVIDSAPLDWEKEEVKYIEKNDSLFGSEKKWLRQQLKNNKITTWDTSFFSSPLIKEVEVVSGLYIDSLFQSSHYHVDRLGIEFIHIGLPLFSQDKKYCFIVYNQWCGRQCGEGGTIVYKKVDGKWERYASYGMVYS